MESDKSAKSDVNFFLIAALLRCETPGPFINHKEWGPIYIEQDIEQPGKLFVYKLKDGLKLLAENMKNGL